MPEQVDCLIVGGGPAGLTAAIYLARFHLSTVVFDDGRSRALQIPCTNNHAGFPDGISGKELLDRMLAHTRRFGVRRVSQPVLNAASVDVGFRVQSLNLIFDARCLLLATGVANRRPAIDDDLHAQALARGRLRYCPVCDGYEITDQDIAVIGSGPRAVSECSFLRSYTDRVTLILEGPGGLSASEAERLRALGVCVVEGPARDFKLEQAGMGLSVPRGRFSFEAIYPALGSVVHSELATSLGAEVTDEGCIQVDPHQRTGIEGLYAAGDVVLGLDQIGHAMGQAAVAATTIRNDLAELEPRLR